MTSKLDAAVHMKLENGCLNQVVRGTGSLQHKPLIKVYPSQHVL